MAIRSTRGLKWDKKRKRADFDFRMPNGKRHRLRNVVCDSKDDAERRFDVFRASFETPAATNIPESTSTFTGYVDQHWDSMSRFWSVGTRSRNDFALRHYILPYLAETLLASFNELTVKELICSLSQPAFDNEGNVVRKGLSAPTINHAVRIVRSVLRNAHQRLDGSSQSVLPRVPMFAVKHGTMLKETELHLELKIDEESRFLNAFDDFDSFKADAQRVERARCTDAFARIRFSHFHASKSIFAISLETGLRISDLLPLRWENVDLNQKVIRLDQQKTDSPVVIPLSQRAIEAIDEIRSRKLVSSTWVFTSPRTGKPFSETTFRRHFAQAKRIAGIARRCRPHDMRHTFGSALVSEGVDIRTASALMGHRDIKTTMRYARSDEQALRKAIKKLDERHAD
jgi:integrase